MLKVPRCGVFVICREMIRPDSDQVALWSVSANGHTRSASRAAAVVAASFAPWTEAGAAALTALGAAAAEAKRRKKPRR